MKRNQLGVGAGAALWASAPRLPIVDVELEGVDAGLLALDLSLVGLEQFHKVRIAFGLFEPETPTADGAHADEMGVGAV